MDKGMVVTFVSNYINHHQLPFCNAMNSMEDVEFHFIQTSPMEEKRVEMGWALDVTDIPYVSLFYEDRNECKRLILDSDVTILGWSDGLISDIEQERLSSGKLTFRVSERIYREGQWKFRVEFYILHAVHSITKRKLMMIYVIGNKGNYHSFIHLIILFS